ncbi:MAG: DNA translocase FtsK [Candidatus Omnitrophica bacterium]|nr:DNA translocase FtsK [Candidatus Omnitrophota bacterium]
MQRLSSVLKSIVFFFSSVIVFLSLISFKAAQIPLIAYPSSARIDNFIGIFGAYLGFGLFFIIGYAAYFLPVYFLFSGLDGINLLRFSGIGKGWGVKSLSFTLFIIFLSSFIGAFIELPEKVFANSGGLIGLITSDFFKMYLGNTGTMITVLLFLSVLSIILFGFFFVDLSLMFKNGFINAAAYFLRLRDAYREDDDEEEIESSSDKKTKKKILKRPKEVIEEKADRRLSKVKPEIKVYTPKMDAIQKKPSFTSQDVGSVREVNKEDIQKKLDQLENENKKPFDPKTYKIPDPEILKVPPHLDYKEAKEDIEGNIKNLEDALNDFGVDAKVVSVQKGPVVTMYELQPAAGVKIQRISALSDDLALAMKSTSVRIVAPLPRKGTVGVEIPNAKKHLVFLREVLEEKKFYQAESKLSFVVGKDVSGAPVVADLKDMPHLLIAGATGSGKTVCVNGIISSILFKAKPNEVKFILIDPKMVELTPYAGVPHLLHPIICEAKKAFAALNWAVGEMESRYRLLAHEGARNIDGYNKKKGGMPYIVIVVDELADLMIVARDNIETLIQRLAQLSRAVGIHLILATQRPSVDVITGVIKANFPARISFKVSAKVDSRTVLDAMGADKLLGKGDLLFLNPGAPHLARCQGAFIDDDDIETLTEFVRAQGAPVYEESIAEEEQKKSNNDMGSDELFDQAVETILVARQASASLVQRRLRVGYTRAARLLDLMEQAGIVGPFCGSKAREILVDPQEYLQERRA